MDADTLDKMNNQDFVSYLGGHLLMEIGRGRFQEAMYTIVQLCRQRFTVPDKAKGNILKKAFFIDYLHELTFDSAQEAHDFHKTLTKRFPKLLESIPVRNYQVKEDLNGKAS